LSDDVIERKTNFGELVKKEWLVGEEVEE